MRSKNLLFPIFLFPSFSYAIEHKDIIIIENPLVPFFNEYLQKNDTKLNNVDFINMSCASELICVAVSYSFDSECLIYNIVANYNENKKIEYIELTSEYPNGSYINSEIIRFTKPDKRVKRNNYFKPSIDGSWLANERALLLRHARNQLNKEKAEENKKKEILNTDKKKVIIQDIIKKETKVINQDVIKNEKKKDTQTYFFKPSIDGSWLANERAILLRESRKPRPQNN